MEGIANIDSESVMIQLINYRYSEKDSIITEAKVSAIYPDGSFIMYGSPGEYKWTVNFGEKK